jgi:hypothetical protein
MASRLFCSAVVMMLLVLAVPASATTLLFDLQSVTNYYFRVNASWTADLSPTPSYVGSSSFLIPVSYLTGDPGNGDHNIVFFTPDYALNGGMELGGSLLYGSQVFTGSLQNPTFLIGSFNFYTGVFQQGHELLTITALPPTATPLPSTWTMLIAGFIGLGFFAYRGSKKSPAALAAA